MPQYVGCYNWGHNFGDVLYRALPIMVFRDFKTQFAAGLTDEETIRKCASIAGGSRFIGLEG